MAAVAWKSDLASVCPLRYARRSRATSLQWKSSSVQTMRPRDRCRRALPSPTAEPHGCAATVPAARCTRPGLRGRDVPTASGVTVREYRTRTVRRSAADAGTRHTVRVRRARRPSGGPHRQCQPLGIHRESKRTSNECECADRLICAPRHCRSTRTDRRPLCVKCLVRLACSCAGDCGRCSLASRSFLPAPAVRGAGGAPPGPRLRSGWFGAYQEQAGMSASSDRRWQF